MSEKQAKRLRRAEARMDAQEASLMSCVAEVERQSDRLRELEEWVSTEAEGAAMAYQARRRERERAEEEKTNAAIWRNAAFVATAAAVFLGLSAACAVWVKGDTPAADKFTRPAVAAVQEVQEENENERIEAALLARAHKLENCKITYYDACVKCCGKADGITASGVKAAPYVTCAVDPAIIPLGSDVLIDYGDGVLHYLRADDTGVAGGHIDVCVPSHQEALWYGVDRATAYWVEVD